MGQTEARLRQSQNVNEEKCPPRAPLFVAALERCGRLPRSDREPRVHGRGHLLQRRRGQRPAPPAAGGRRAEKPESGAQRGMVRVHHDAGVQSRPVRANLPPHRALRADLTGVLHVWHQGRPQAPQRPRLDVRGLRSRPGPGHQRGDRHREGRRTGGISMSSAGKTGSPTGAARRSRNPPEDEPDIRQPGGNRLLSVGEDVKSRGCCRPGKRRQRFVPTGRICCAGGRSCRP
jgi:hypothetical protein